MEKKLPGVFPGKVKKNSGNNKQVFYSNKEEVEEIKETEVSSLPINIEQKLNRIFNSPDYIYKADVEVNLKDGKVIKRIVGRNRTHLITMENELIPISDVIDINKI